MDDLKDEEERKSIDNEGGDDDLQSFNSDSSLDEEVEKIQDYNENIQ